MLEELKKISMILLGIKKKKFFLYFEKLKMIKIEFIENNGECFKKYKLYYFFLSK